MKLKRLITLAFAIIFAFSSAIILFVEADYTNQVMDGKIIDVIKSQLSPEEYSELMATENYNNSLESDALKDYPILRVYNSVYWEYASNPFNEFMSKVLSSDSKKQHHLRYVVFGREVFSVVMLKWEDGSVTIGKARDYDDSVPSMISDIINLQETIEVDGERYTIKNIYCFDETSSFKGAVLYLITDSGIFVKYYENESAEGMLFTEDDFRIKASEYHRYITSYEHNYNEKGEALGGRNVSFAEYLDLAPTFLRNPGTSPWKIILATCAAAAVIAASFFIVRGVGKKKPEHQE
ncbi:MAG: hypothetical protein IKX86_00245 [Clostridia bacterium]|nr:hypothetical protein [Clostridia bacterium]